MKPFQFLAAIMVALLVSASSADYITSTLNRIRARIAGNDYEGVWAKYTPMSGQPMEFTPIVFYRPSEVTYGPEVEVSIDKPQSPAATITLTCHTNFRGKLTISKMAPGKIYYYDPSADKDPLKEIGDIQPRGEESVVREAAIQALAKFAAK